jgi:hypothetical protein
LSPELVAALLVVVVLVIGLIGIFGLAAPGRPGQAPEDSVDPSASAVGLREFTISAAPVRLGVVPILDLGVCGRTALDSDDKDGACAPSALLED